MYKLDGHMVYSPSDLVRYVQSPFASWMARKYLEDPDSLEPDPEDEQLKLFASRGNAHERAALQAMIENGRDVCEVPGARNLDATLEAIQQGREVIYQGYLAHGDFAGYTDFLIREQDGAGYCIWDTKLALSVKPYFLIQLCTYADLLAELNGTFSRKVGIILGDDSRRSFVTEEYFDYYRWIKANFLNFMADFPGDGPPLPDSMADHGVWASHAAARLEEVDHLSRVANITKSQIIKLERSCIATMTDLVSSTAEHVPGISPEVFGRLKEQAVLQSDSKGKQSPSYKVLQPPTDNPALGMAALPPAISDGCLLRHGRLPRGRSLARIPLRRRSYRAR